MSVAKLIRAIVIAMLASALVYAVMIFVSDGSAVARALAGFSPRVTIAMLVLSLGGYAIRSIRWGWLMRLIGYPVSTKDAVYLHMSGQTMSVSPGRVGEILKPWLAREVAGMPLPSGIALVFAERVADLIAVSLLALAGLSALGTGVWGLLIGLGVVVAGVLVASSGWFHRIALGVVEKHSWAKKYESSAQAVSHTIRTALNWRIIAVSTVLSVTSWGLEGVAFWLCVRELGFTSHGPLACVSVFAIATIAGAFTFLPGGIGVTEASMAGILVALGMPAAGASAATLVTRVITLWWGVLLGWITLATRPALLRRLLAISAEETPG